MRAKFVRHRRPHFFYETAAWNYFILHMHISLGGLFDICENGEGGLYAPPQKLVLVRQGIFFYPQTCLVLFSFVASVGVRGSFEKLLTTENYQKLPKRGPRAPADETFIVETHLVWSRGLICGGHK